MSFGTSPRAARSAVARSAGYNLAGQLLPLVVAVGTVPVVVRELGPARFGLLALAWTVVGYASLFDLGFGRAATQRIAAAAAEPEAETRIGRIATTVIAAQALLGVLGAVVLWLVAPALAGVLVPGGDALRAEGEAMLRVLALGLPAVLVMNGQRAVLEGLSRFDLVNTVRAPFTVALFVIPLAGVLLGWTLIGIVAGLVVSRWAAAGVFGWVHGRIARGSVGGFDGAELRRMARFGAWVALTNALIPAVVYLERIVVTAQHGPAALAYYAAPHELAQKLLSAPAALSSVLYPVFSGLEARSESGRLASALGGGTRTIAVLFAPLVLLFVLFAEPLLRLWLGVEYGAEGAPVLRLLATAAFLNALALVPFVMIEGIGRPDLVTKYHAAEFPVYCVLLWVFVGRWGLTGAAVAWLLRVTWMTSLFFRMALRSSGIAARDPALRGAMRAGAAGVVSLALAHVWVWRMQETPVVWVGVVLPVLHAVIAWRWLLSAEDRSWLRGVARRLGATRAGFASSG